MNGLPLERKRGLELPPYCPIPRSQKSCLQRFPRCWRAGKRAGSRSRRAPACGVAGPAAGSSPPFCIWTKLSRALSPSRAQRMTSWRGKGIARLKKPPLKLQPRMGALALHAAALHAAALLVARPSLSPSLRPEKRLLRGCKPGRLEGPFRRRHAGLSFCGYVWEEHTSQVSSSLSVL